MHYKNKFGQFNTKKIITDQIVCTIKKDKSSLILEPCAGSGNFVKSLKENGYNNILYYDIDKKYADGEMIIADFIKETIDKKVDIVIGNPPFTNLKDKKTFYEGKLIEYLFLEKCLNLLKDDGELHFILPNRIFIDERYKQFIEAIEKSKFSVCSIKEMPMRSYESYQYINCIYIILKKGCKNCIIDFNDSKHKITKQQLIDNNYNYLKIIANILYNKGQNKLENYIEPIRRKSKGFKINVSNMYDYGNDSGDYIAIVRIGNYSVGKFTFFSGNYTFNSCFYLFKIKGKHCKKISNALKSKEFVSYIEILSRRIGPRSIKKEDILEFKI